MKNITSIIAIALLLLSAAACKTTKVDSSPTAEVKFLSEADNVLNLRSIAFGKDEEDAKENAIKNAFEILFFRGIPGSQYGKAMLGTDEKLKQQHAAYFKTFYDGKRCKTFTTRLSKTSHYEIEKNKVKAVMELSINLRALRDDLEQNKVMPKFGLN